MADNGKDAQLEGLLNRKARLAAQIRQLLAKKRGLSGGPKSIADEAEELFCSWAEAELRGDNSAAVSKMTILLKEHHRVSEQIVDIGGVDL